MECGTCCLGGSLFSTVDVSGESYVEWVQADIGVWSCQGGTEELTGY